MFSFGFKILLAKFVTEYLKIVVFAVKHPKIVYLLLDTEKIW